MRDARLVSLSSDGQWLIIDGAGEHLRLPVDDALRAAVRHEVQLPMPLSAPVSPRDVQRRIRNGETAEHIAEGSGVAVERIARFEGPVLDERRWQAERARRSAVDGMSLEERFAVAVHDHEGAALVTWDAWVDRDDGGWRISATCADDRSAEWSWDSRTGKLRGRNDLARFALSGRVVGDDLEAVLRPLGSSRDVHEAREPSPTQEPPNTTAPDDAPRTGAKKRPTVPSWGEIVSGSTRPASGFEPKRRESRGED